MSTILDIVGSFIVGGLLMLMILRTNMNFSEQTVESKLELSAQENISELVEEIEFDFRKIGYGVVNPALSITSADTSSITFLADLDNDGTVDIVTYRLGPRNELRNITNPRARILHRIINGRPGGNSLGVVNFQLTFYDISGAPTTDLTLVKTIDYFLQVESPFPIDTTYARSTWRGTIRPRNL